MYIFYKDKVIIKNILLLGIITLFNIAYAGAQEIDCENTIEFDSCIDKVTNKKIYVSKGIESKYWIPVDYSCYKCKGDGPYVVGLICGGTFSLDDCKCKYNKSILKNNPQVNVPPSNITIPMPCF